MKIFSAQLKGTTTVATGSNVSLTGSFSGSIAGIDINSTNTFTGSTISRLNSIETVSASNVSRIGSLESFSSSIYTTNTFTSSTSARLNSLETTSASVNTLNTTQNNRLDLLEAKTGSLATTGSNFFNGNQTITGSLFISADLIVQGTSSIQNITGSAINIGTNIVNLNTATPAVRYAGVAVQDSGSSAGVTGSILWDSLCNRWMYSNPSTVGYSGGIIMSGPRASTLGTETTLTCNYVAKSGGGDHLYDSCIIDDGTTICAKGNFIGTGTACFSGQLNTITGVFGNKGGGNYGVLITDNDQSNVRLRFTNSGTGGQSMSIVGGNPALSNSGLAIYDETNSSTRLYISSNGCIGINTNNPQSLFDIQNCINVVYDNTNTLTSNQWLRLSNLSTCAGATSGILFVATGPGGGNGLATINGVTTSCGSMGITFGTRDSSGAVSEKMRIQSIGIVSMGTQTSAPCTHAGPNVGGLIVQGLNGCRGIIEIWDAISGKGVFQQVNGTTYLGNLDKGTGTGELQLLVNGAGASATTAMTLTKCGHIVVNNSPNAQADYGRMTISTSTPKTSNPGTQEITALHLSTCESDTPFGLKFQLIGGTCNCTRYASLQTGDHYVSNQGNIVLQLSGGNVGIGMNSPQSLLHIMRGSGNGAEIYASYGSCGIRSEFVHNSSGGAVNLRRESDGSVNTLLRGYGDSYLNVCVGNLGIGTTSPSGPLHVDGNNYQGSSITNVFITDHGNQYCSNCEAVRLTFQSRYWSGDNNVSAVQSSLRHGKSYYNGYGGSYLAIATSNIDGNQYERFRINHRGTLSLGGDFSGGDYYTTDTTPGMCLVPSGGQINFCYMSGMLVVNDWNDGSVTLYLAGGGNTTMIGNVQRQTGCFWYNPSIVGYSWSNTSGASRCYGFFVARTRSNA